MSNVSSDEFRELKKRVEVLEAQNAAAQALFSALLSLLEYDETLEEQDVRLIAANASSACEETSASERDLGLMKEWISAAAVLRSI